MNNKNNSGLFKFFFIKTNFSVLSLFLFVVGGLIAYDAMIKESTPDLEIPQAIVATAWWGASPELIEKEVTARIEQKIKSLKGLKLTRSGSQKSFSLISVEFLADADMQESMQLLTAKVAEAASEFPSGVEKSTIEKIAVSDIPIMTLAIYGDKNDEILNQTAFNVKNRLMRIPGMRKVEIIGARETVVQVMLRPERLGDLGISPTLVRERIQAANLDTPWGTFENKNFKADFKLSGRFDNLDDLKNLPVIRLGQGRIVRLGEIANIKKGLSQELTQAHNSQGGEAFKKSISFALYKIPGRDTIHLSKVALAELAAIQQSPSWPSWIHCQIASDESKQIKNNLSMVFNNAWQAMLAVFLVLMFLLTWREALVACLAIPVTFLGAVLILWGLGHTINEMVIVGMILALGLLVDDFILMMEGMHEAIYIKKLAFYEALKDTLSNFAVPSLSGSLTTIFVFLPLMAIGGLDGKFIRIIPLTTAICLVLSYLVSIFIALPLSGVVLKQVRTTSTPARIDLLTEKLSKKLYNWLMNNAVGSKKKAGIWFAGILTMFVLTLIAVSLLPSQMYPKADGTNLGITVELPPSTRFEDSKKVANQLWEILREKPYFQSVTKYAGKKSPFAVDSISEMFGETMAPYLVGFSALFVPKNAREKLAFEYVEPLRQELEASLKTVPGAILIFTPQTGGSTSDDPVQVELYGNDMEVLRQISREVQNTLAKTPGATDVRNNLGAARNDVQFIPRRETLDFYEISQLELASQMRLAMLEEKVGKFKVKGIKDDLDILLGMAWPSRNGEFGTPTQWEELASIDIYNSQQKRIPLPALVDSKIDTAPLTILHKNKFRMVTVMAKTQGRTAVEIINQIRPALDTLQRSWPSGYRYHFAGEAESTQEISGSSGKAFVGGLFLVFATLVLLFGSYKQPFIIMFSVPFALIGTFGGFFLAWIPLSFPAMIGIIALVGIVVNDSIVMVETMNLHRNKGLSTPEAAARGGSDRLRPIISTTVTTIVGLVPLALSSPMWMPLCNAIIFGLLAATIISLILVPCLYLLLTTDSPEVLEENK